MIPHYQKCFRKCLFWATRFLLDITCLVPVYPPGCALPCYRGIIRNRFTLYTGHLVPEPNRILFHTVIFFNFVLYGLPVLRSAERALASARLLNNRTLRHSYCSRGERSQCPLYWTGLRTLVPADMVQCWTQNFYDTEMNESKMYICSV